jgi:hypothetical protein
MRYFGWQLVFFFAVICLLTGCQCFTDINKNCSITMAIPI